MADDWTDERKAAAVELARLRRPHAHPDSIVAKLCDLIDPPAPAPVIAARPEAAARLLERMKPEAFCDHAGCTWADPRCAKHIGMRARALANGMPASGRHG